MTALIQTIWGINQSMSVFTGLILGTINITFIFIFAHNITKRKSGILNGLISLFKIAFIIASVWFALMYLHLQMIAFFVGLSFAIVIVIFEAIRMNKVQGFVVEENLIKWE